MKPKLLDLFCGAGGAAVGYHRAGFDIFGVDNRPQPNYPFPFIQADAVDYLEDGNYKQFDVIHASPPCQRWSSLSHLYPETEYIDLLTPTAAILRSLGRPYVIENVIKAPLHNPVVLCGTFFGLKVFRHRAFETSPWLMGIPHITHSHFGTAAKQGRKPTPGQYIHVTGNFSGTKFGGPAMGIDWPMTKKEMSQAIPPAYTEWIGRHLLRALNAQRSTHHVTHKITVS